jgi:putative intracellular protease/amidase
VTASIDILDPAKPKRVAMLVSNPAVSPVTGWPVGFWWAELVHPYWELTEHGYEVDIHSPDGGALVADAWSDPRDESGFSAEDILSLGFIARPSTRPSSSRAGRWPTSTRPPTTGSSSSAARGR